ncbi:MAG: hypothetical protein KGI71_04030 [Patescibacteria group bacterium]|nr:hypothetical protein [Patescibacteria group bacterium]
MSFEKPFKTEKKSEVDPSKCTAYGCPCRASISVNAGRFFCVYHAFIPSEKWQETTHKLREHEWLAAFISEVQKMDQAHQNWREFARRFWAESDAFCAPDPMEDASPYCNRMRGELAFRVGQAANRPAVRLPQTVKPGGQFARGMRHELETA